MRLIFTHTQYNPDPENEAVWILTADVDTEMYTDGNQDTFGCYVANILTALTHDESVNATDLDPRLLAEMEQAAIAWVNERRESLPEMFIAESFSSRVDKYLANRAGRIIGIGTHAECFNALLNFIKTPQTTT